MIGIVGCSCGGCCGKNIPCDKCLNNTLKANGISLDIVGRFKGLKNKASGYQYPFDFSELAYEIRKYNKEKQ